MRDPSRYESVDFVRYGFIFLESRHLSDQPTHADPLALSHNEMHDMYKRLSLDTLVNDLRLSDCFPCEVEHQGTLSFLTAYLEYIPRELSVSMIFKLRHNDQKGFG